MGILQKVVVGVGTVALTVIVAYTTVGDQLPPRTALKVARVVSGLTIPNGAEVVTFEDHWANLNGDGSAYVVLEVREEEMRVLVIEADKEGYGPIVFERLLSDQVKAAIPPSTVGLARTTGDQRSGSTVVVDTEARRLIIHQYVS